MKAVPDKKRGRPTRGERAPTVNLTLRLRPSLLDELRKHAQKNESSIAAEAEARLSQPRVGELARMIEMVVGAVELRAGKIWSEDDAVKRQCRAAAEFTLNVLLGSPLDTKAVHSALQFYLDVLRNASSDNPGTLSKALATTIKKEEMKRMFDLLQDWSDGQKQADETLEAVLAAKS